MVTSTGPRRPAHTPQSAWEGPKILVTPRKHGSTVTKGSAYFGPSEALTKSSEAGAAKAKAAKDAF
jgi:hypothetical protein